MEKKKIFKILFVIITVFGQPAVRNIELFLNMSPSFMLAAEEKNAWNYEADTQFKDIVNRLVVARSGIKYGAEVDDNLTEDVSEYFEEMYDVFMKTKEFRDDYVPVRDSRGNIDDDKYMHRKNYWSILLESYGMAWKYGEKKNNTIFYISPDTKINPEVMIGILHKEYDREIFEKMASTVVETYAQMEEGSRERLFNIWLKNNKNRRAEEVLEYRKILYNDFYDYPVEKFGKEEWLEALKNDDSNVVLIYAEDIVANLAFTGRIRDSVELFNEVLSEKKDVEYIRFIKQYSKDFASGK